MAPAVVFSGESRAHSVWKLGLLALAGLSITIITFEVAFVHEPRAATSVLIYLIDIVFLADIWIRSRTAYRDRGVKVWDPSLIRSHYVKRRMPVALIGALPIDLIFFAFTGEPWGISLVLWARLLRLVRFETIFGSLHDFERGASSNSAVLRIVRLVTVAAAVLHLLSCIWYLIPFVGGFPEDSWPVREAVVGEGGGSAYLLAIYWVVTATTTVGFGDITPENSAEYVFSLLVMLIGASLFAYVIASGAALISSVNLSKATFWSRVETVESYLRSRRVDPSVSQDVSRYYGYVWDRHRGVTDQTLLSDLPPALRLRVFSELVRDLLPNVPIFSHASGALRDELLMSLTPTITHPGGYLVNDGEVADGIYFIADGTVEVVSADAATIHATLGPGDYFGELTLMLGERRSASVRSVGFTEAFVLDAEAFERIRAAYPELREVLTKASSERSRVLADLVLDGVVL